MHEESAGWSEQERKKLLATTVANIYVSPKLSLRSHRADIHSEKMIQTSIEQQKK